LRAIQACDINYMNWVFLNKFTHILKIVHMKQNKSTVIECFHRKIDIVAQ
jgi:hypothetical protein